MDLGRISHRAASAAPLLSIDIFPAFDDRLARLDVAGELDGSTTEDLLGALRRVLQPPAPDRVELHIAGLTFMDSAGIRCLLACRAAAQEAGSRLLLVDPTPHVFQSLDITGLLDVFGLAGGTGRDIEGRSPHRAQALPELLAQSAALCQTAQETCARAEAARRVRLAGRGPETA